MDPATILVPLALACAVLGTIMGNYRNASGTGLVLGLIFGPLGLIAMLAVDRRPQCPTCRARINEGGSRCAACRQPLVWDDSGPVTPEEADEVQAEELQAERQRILAEPTAAEKLGAAARSFLKK